MRCLVLGCGNLLAADDAIGLWVVRYLKELATKKEPADQEAWINELDGQKPSGQGLDCRDPVCQGSSGQRASGQISGCQEPGNDELGCQESGHQAPECQKPDCQESSGQELGHQGPGCQEPGYPDCQESSDQASVSSEDRDKLGEVGSDSGQALTASREKKIKLPPGTVVLEVGTPGLNLLNYWAPEDRVILVDAIRSGRPPGTIQRLTLTELLSIERSNNLTAHGLGIIEALELARLTGNLPAELVLIGIEIANEEPFQIGLSPAVERAIVPAAEMVQAELSRFNLSYY
jgi:hydrogenase maturation protease